MTALARVPDDLLLAAQSGDRHALTQLLVALQPDIRRYARRLCHRTSVIEDVVQEALIVVYRRVGTIRDWVSKDRLDGSFRRRGKHLFFWRDKVLDIVFNGTEWK